MSAYGPKSVFVPDLIGPLVVEEPKKKSVGDAGNYLKAHIIFGSFVSLFILVLTHFVLRLMYVLMEKCFKAAALRASPEIRLDQAIYVWLKISLLSFAARQGMP